MAEQDEIDGPRTSGMVALIPAPEDAERLAVAGGEDPDQMHITLLYLGDDVSDWDDALIDSLTDQLDSQTTELGGPLGARVIGPGHFNPDGGPDGDRDPCAVYLIGDAPGLVSLRDGLRSHLEGLGRQLPDQYDPYLPHITAGYNMDPSMLSEVGPVSFDRLRLSLGDQEIDFPLGEPFQELDDAYGQPEPVSIDETAIKEAAMAGVETKVASPDPRAARLREHWAHGKGRSKWFRGLKVKGNFKRLRRQLAKYVQDPRILNGLTANIYHLATGMWPGRRRGKALSQVAVEIKTIFDPDGPDAFDDTLDPAEVAMCDGIDEWGAEFADMADDVADPDEAGDATFTGEEKTILGPSDIRAAAEVKAFFDVADADSASGVDQLMLDLDRYDLLADQLVSTEELTDDPDDEPWTEVVGRDRSYQVDAAAELVPIVEQGKVSRQGTATGATQPAALM